MKIKKVDLEIGLEKPLKLLLTADNHISYWDEREGKTEQEHAKIRNLLYFSNGGGEENLIRELKSIFTYAKENCHLLCMAGDVIDHPSHKNLELFSEELKGIKHIYAIGNHDYNNYSVESESIGLLAERESALWQTVGYRPFNTSIQYGGLNIVALHDVLYQFDGEAIEFLRRELTRGLPILLLFHIPLYADTLLDPTVAYWKSPILTGAPAEAFEKYSCRVRPVGEKTREMLEIIKNEPLIRGVLAGHIHFDHEDILPCGKPQIVCEAGYLGSATEITVY